MKKLIPILMALMLMVTHFEAEARRMGGGKSFGRQSNNVTQRQATPPAAPATPAQNANAARPGTPAAAPAAAPKRPWGAMLGGLAAGLGLAWLANSLGLGAGFGQVLMLLLVAMAGFALFRMLRSRSKPASSPFAFQGAGSDAPASAPVAREYSPDKVGNDASARPWERSSMAFDAQRSAGSAANEGSIIGSALSGSQNWGVPEGFDTAGFLEAAKRNFITLQSAWDASDIATLRSMMTDSMVDEIRGQLTERESHRGAQPNHTDVVMLEAQLLGIEELGDAYMASVEFSGMIREELSASPSPFREVWNMTKPASGQSGWLVAGVQALQ